MKRILLALAAISILTACKNEKQENATATETDTTATTAPEVLSFDNKVYEKKTTLPKKEPRTYVNIDVPDAVGSGEVSDSINNKIFHVVRSIVYFGEKPTNAKSYAEIMDTFIKSYEDLAKKYPDEDIPWEAKVKGTIDLKNDTLINIRVHHYTFTGGAHGYEGDRSLLFNAKTGRSIAIKDLFKNEKGFTALAEKKFREKYKIPAGKNINSTGLMFPNDKFVLPQNIFLTEDGLVLYYNAYEVASYADRQKEITIPYGEAKAYLK